MLAARARRCYREHKTARMQNGSLREVTCHHQAHVRNRGLDADRSGAALEYANPRHVLLGDHTRDSKHCQAAVLELPELHLGPCFGVRGPVRFKHIQKKEKRLLRMRIFVAGPRFFKRPLLLSHPGLSGAIEGNAKMTSKPQVVVRVQFSRAT